MSLVKFSEYFDEAVEIGNGEAIVEWTEEGWNSLTIAERAELEAEAITGWAMWHIGPLDKDFDGELDPDDEKYTGRFVAYEGASAISEYIDTINEAACDACGEDPCVCDPDVSEEITPEMWLEKYKARNTQQRRKTQKNKDRMKFKNRGAKLKAKINRKKGGNKVKRIKLRKKWMRINKSKIKNAHKVYGGKVHSKFTKKKK
jgi:hypothetical protein